MLRYSIEEAKRLAWIKKIKEINSRREIKQTLLRLLDENFDEFLAEKCRLLDNNHGQGIFWTSTLSWLWTTISFLLPFVSNWNPMPGSQLREALEEGIAIPELDPLSLDDTPASQDNLLDDKSYENALFEDPKSALSDIQGQMSALAGELTDRDGQNIDNIIERLHALKLRLAPETYHQLLSKLFQKYPIETLSFYLNCYQNYYAPGAHDVIEHQLISQTLMDIFVFQHNPDPITSQLYATQKLLLLLVPNKGSALKEILTKAKESGLTPQQLLNDVDKFYEDHIEVDQTGQSISIKGVRTRIEERLEIKSKGQHSPRQILEQVFETKMPEFRLAKQTLFPHIARLASHAFIQDYHQKKWEEKESEGSNERFQTLRLFGEKILGTWEKVKKIGSYKDFDRLTWNTMLNPSELGGVIGTHYRHAILYTHQILVANTFNAALAEARIIGKSSHKRPLNKDELTWIFDSLKRVEPEGLQLAREVKHILTETFFFNEDDLDSLNKMTDHQPGIDQLIEEMEAKLAFADKAREKLSELYKSEEVNEQTEKEIIKEENEAIKEIVTIFNHLLNNKELKATQLEKIFELFKKLAPVYLTEELAKNWKKKIFTQQKQLCCVKKEGLLTLSIEGPSEPSLSLVKQPCEKANTAKELVMKSSATGKDHFFFKADEKQSLDQPTVDPKNPYNS